jgi:DNA-3-methyladenine glycosylase
LSAPSLTDLLAGPVQEAAVGLLGRRLVSHVDGVRCEVLLTEVEAYGGSDDPASHAYRGRTARNASMFGPPGTLYVYRSYGVHWCLNVVTGPEGEASAVLLRGGIPVAGEPEMRTRRRRIDHLTDGPGKMAQALAITGAHDGAWLLGEGEVEILGTPEVAGTVVAGPRVGVSRAADRQWRFLIAAPV